GKPSAGPTEEPTSSASPSTAPTAPPSPSANGDGDLAETGSSAPLGTITVVAAALFGAGGYLAARRRKAQH
ncbi:LPXTG cell wall anchor domain-containing protein, partial [Streptomyces lunaelactis]|uniref:LPXTG cell wall anchor domain-containing protein n=1 Tax=Streptomyces lunaelactis TaxID=1535768 RepID=UPI0015853C3B